MSLEGLLEFFRRNDAAIGQLLPEVFLVQPCLLVERSCKLPAVYLALDRPVFRQQRAELHVGQLPRRKETP